MQEPAGMELTAELTRRALYQAGGKSRFPYLGHKGTYQILLNPKRQTLNPKPLPNSGVGVLGAMGNGGLVARAEAQRQIHTQPKAPDPNPNPQSLEALNLKP